MQPQPREQELSAAKLLLQSFKKRCKETLFNRQPSVVVCGWIKDQSHGLTSIEIDVDLLTVEDMPVYGVLFTLGCQVIRFFRSDDNVNSKKETKQSLSNGNPNKTSNIVRAFWQTYKMKELLTLLAKAIVQTQTVKSLSIERVPLEVSSFKVLSHGIQHTASLKNFKATECDLTDMHIEAIKGALASNPSLMVVDLSNNLLKEVGDKLGKVLSTHSERRNKIVWGYGLRNQLPPTDISAEGMCELKLANNQIDDKAALKMIEFLKADKWTRCLNLRDNLLSTEVIKEFSRLLKVNNNLLCLDLRGNPGFTNKFSRYIFDRLNKNIAEFKKLKENYNNGHHVERIMGISKGSRSPSKASRKENSHSFSASKRHDSNRVKITVQSSQQLQPIRNLSLAVDNMSESNPNKTIGRGQKMPACEKCDHYRSRLSKAESLTHALQGIVQRYRGSTHNYSIESSEGDNSRNHSLSSRLLGDQSELVRIVSPTRVVSSTATQNYQTNLANQDQSVNPLVSILNELTKLVDSFEFNESRTIDSIPGPFSNAHNHSNTVRMYEKTSSIVEEFKSGLNSSADSPEGKESQSMELILDIKLSKES